MNKLIFILTILVCFLTVGHSLGKDSITNDYQSSILSHIVNPHQHQLKFYWKDENNKNYASFQNLKSSLESEQKKLVFATNGGMYNQSFSPQGLYIENGKTLAPIDTKNNGYGNFYLQPNGIFLLTKDNNPEITTTVDFENSGNVQYATQSGPMLLIDGKVHSKFNKNSKHINIRNGVGILPNGNILFAMSKQKINFYEFATYFKLNGCKNALYLDGFVSRTYLPSKQWEQLEGNFGVIIAVTE